MSGLRFTPGATSTELTGQPGFFDFLSMVSGHWQSPTSAECGCCDETTRVCWHRYATNEIAVPGASAPTPLGGPTETTPGSGIFSSFWVLETGSAAPYSTENIHINSPGAKLYCTVTADKVEVKFRIIVDGLNDGDVAGLRFNRVDANNYCYFEFVANDGFAEVGIYKVVAAGAPVKIYKRVNSITGLVYAGDKTVTMGVSLCRGMVQCAILESNITGLNTDDTGTHPIVGGEYIGDVDEEPSVTIRPLVIHAELPLLPTDTTTEFSGNTAGIQGTTGSQFDVTYFSIQNTNRNAFPDESNADNDCKPATICGGWICSYPVIISLSSSRVTKVAKRWNDCDGHVLNQLEDPGPPYLLEQDCDCEAANTAVDNYLLSLCHYVRFIEENGSCTDYFPCTTGIPVTTPTGLSSFATMVAQGLQGQVSGDESGSLAAGTYSKIIPTPPNASDIGPSFVKPSDIEGQLLNTQDTAPDTPTLCSYVGQHVVCDSITFEDSD